MVPASCSGRFNWRLTAYLFCAVGLGALIYLHNNQCAKEMRLRFLRVIKPLATKLHGRSGRTSSVDKPRPPPEYHPIYGSCSVRASNEGRGQKVVSFSLYGNYSKIASVFEETIADVDKHYPDFKIWIYAEPHLYQEEIAGFMEKYPQVFACDVVNLPHPLKNIKRVHPKLWSVSPLGDDLVDLVFPRNVDGKVKMIAFLLTDVGSTSYARLCLINGVQTKGLHSRFGFSFR